MEVPATRFDDWPPWRYFAIVPLIFVAGLVTIAVGAALLIGLFLGLHWFAGLLPRWAYWTLSIFLAYVDVMLGIRLAQRRRSA